MTSTTAAVPATAMPRIGRDAGPFGRVFRLVTGVLAVLAAITAIHGTGDGAWTAGFVVALALFYLLVHWILGLPALSRLDPFVATVLVLGWLPVFGLSVFPHPLHVATGLYIGASLIINAVIRYGGCELVALPTAVFRRRRVVYCPINIVDAAERPLDRASGLLDWTGVVLAVVVAGYYLVVTQLLDRFTLPEPLSARWALLLVAPAALLAWRAWNGRAIDRSQAWTQAFGAGALLALAVTINGWVGENVVFGAAIVAGLIVAGVRLVIGHLHAAESEGRDDAHGDH